jgi:hypothetical protein
MKERAYTRYPCPCGCGRSIERTQLTGGEQVTLPTRTCYRRVRHQCRSAGLPYQTFMNYYRFMAGAGPNDQPGRRPVFVLGKPGTYYLLARNRTHELPDPLGRILWEVSMTKEC